MENNKIKLLIVDDEESIRFALSELFNGQDFTIKTSSSGEEALNIIENEAIDIVIADYQLKGINGIELLKKIKVRYNHIQVLLITAFGSEDIAVTAIKNGAFDYISKPFKNEELINRVNHIKNVLLNQKIQFEKDDGYYFSGIMNSLIEKVKTVAKTDAPVLITGESGTGKELMARICHKYSNCSGKFVTINCSALPAALIESELFGAEKGSYTDAYKTKIGLFEAADQGTLFLDEIGDMPIELQSKLLRVLQEEEILRIGGNDPIKISTRIIAATNKNIENEVKNKTFREDLYYRLNVIRINIPSLRERKEEISPISLMFLNEFKKKYKKNIAGFDIHAQQLILDYSWPGNVRELRNKIEQAVILTNSEWIGINELFIGEKKLISNKLENINEIRQNNEKNIKLKNKEIDNSNLFAIKKEFNELPKDLIKAKKTISKEFEKKYIIYYLNKNNWNVSVTAKEIGLYRQDLYKKIKELNIKKE
jgi:DNA-binding NtrC family response regulator